MGKEKSVTKGVWVGIVSFVGNILLFVIKLWAATVTHSVALMADAWHTVSDSISTVIVIVGLKISAKPADQEHPYGHQRAETISAIFIGFFLIIVSFEFGKDAILRLMEKQGVTYGKIGVWVMVFSVLIKEAMARISIFVGKKYNSTSLEADGWHHRSDAVSSIIILVGMFFNRYVWWMDSLLAFAISIYILYIAIRIVGKAIQPIMGTNVEPELREEIIALCKKEYKDELYFHHFHKHEYGKHTEMTFHIILPEQKTIKEAAGITKLLFKKIKDETGIIATIHIDTDSKYKDSQEEVQ